MQFFNSKNQILLKALSPGSDASGSRLDTALVEFSNSGTVPPVEYTDDDIAAHFAGFAGSPDQDYLRVPVLSHTLKTENNVTTLTLVIAADGNSGVNGKPFTSGNGSTVYAVTIAASQSGGRPDILFARQAYAENQQLIKPDQGNVILTVILS